MLSNATRYPNFVRVRGHDDLAFRAIVKLFDFYTWKRIFVVYDSTDSYQVRYLKGFLKVANGYGIEVGVGDIQAGVDKLWEDSMGKYPFAVYVVLVYNPATVVAFVERGREAVKEENVRRATRLAGGNTPRRLFGAGGMSASSAKCPCLTSRQVYDELDQGTKGG